MIWFVFGMLLKLAACGPCDYGNHYCGMPGKPSGSIPCECPSGPTIYLEDEIIVEGNRSCVPVSCIGEINE